MLMIRDKERQVWRKPHSPAQIAPKFDSSEGAMAQRQHGTG